jgi:hypothetical protein
VSCPLIVCEFHLDLVIEFNIASGDLVVYLSQFFEKPTIGGGLVDFGFIFSALRLLSLSSKGFLVTLVLAACLSRMA